eukprot:2693676-Amphidinium_carterae.1
MEIEADQRHVTMVLRELGLDAGHCKGKDLANVKLTAQESEEIDKTPVLLGDRAKQYRSLVMRIAYLSQDRVDLLESVRHMASRMKDPREGDWVRVQRVGSFLLRHPCLVTVHGPQSTPKCIRVIVDSDHAGEPLRRRSTTGAFTMLGNHCLRGQSNWQSTVALSSGESEYYAIVKAAAQGLHTAAVCRDLGLELGVQIAGKADMSVEIHSDSSAARAFAQREGLGKQKHEQVEQGKIGIKRVGTRDNQADMLTKPLVATAVKRHLDSLGFGYRATWSQLHRQLEASAAALFALDKEGADTSAISAQDRDVLRHSLVRQRVAALETQLRQRQADASEVGHGGPTRVLGLLSNPSKEERKSYPCPAPLALVQNERVKQHTSICTLLQGSLCQCRCRGPCLFPSYVVLKASSAALPTDNRTPSCFSQCGGCTASAPETSSLCKCAVVCVCVCVCVCVR